MKSLLLIFLGAIALSPICQAQGLASLDTKIAYRRLVGQKVNIENNNSFMLKQEVLDEARAQRGAEMLVRFYNNSVNKCEALKSKSPLLSNINCSNTVLNGGNSFFAYDGHVTPNCDYCLPNDGIVQAYNQIVDSLVADQLKKNLTDQNEVDQITKFIKSVVADITTDASISGENRESLLVIALNFWSVSAEWKIKYPDLASKIDAQLLSAFAN